MLDGVSGRSGRAKDTAGEGLAGVLVDADIIDSDNLIDINAVVSVVIFYLEKGIKLLFISSTTERRYFSFFFNFKTCPSCGTDFGHKRLFHGNDFFYSAVRRHRASTNEPFRPSIRLHECTVHSQ